MPSTVEQLQQHMFEMRDMSKRQPRLHVGVLVKVGIRGERFWCKVSEIREDGSLVGTVDNELFRSPWRCGDEIVLQRNHVLETLDPYEMTLASLLATGTPAPEAAMMWHELRLMNGLGAKAKPGTVAVLPGTCVNEKRV